MSDQIVISRPELKSVLREVLAEAAELGEYRAHDLEPERPTVPVECLVCHGPRFETATNLSDDELTAVCADCGAVHVREKVFEDGPDGPYTWSDWAIAGEQESLLSGIDLSSGGDQHAEAVVIPSRTVDGALTALVIDPSGVLEEPLKPADEDPPRKPSRYRPRINVHTPDWVTWHDALMDSAEDMESLIDAIPDGDESSRLKALAITKLEEAVMFAVKASTR